MGDSHRLPPPGDGNDVNPGLWQSGFQHSETKEQAPLLGIWASHPKAVKIADYNRGFPSHNCLLLLAHFCVFFFWFFLFLARPSFSVGFSMAFLFIRLPFEALGLLLENSSAPIEFSPHNDSQNDKDKDVVVGSILTGVSVGWLAVYFLFFFFFISHFLCLFHTRKHLYLCVQSGREVLAERNSVRLRFIWSCLFGFFQHHHHHHRQSPPDEKNLKFANL